MKIYFKLLSFIVLVTCFIGCDSSSDLGYNPETNIGWIQFTGSLDNPATFNYQQSYDVAARVGVNVQVPEVENDFTIGYNLVSVSGLDPNAAFSNSGSIVSPAGESSYAGPDNNSGFDYVYLADIELDLTELPTLTEPMIFDIVLVSSSDVNITVGLNNEKPTSQRVTICPAVENLFVGDYQITSEGDNFVGVSFDQTVTITADPNDPYARSFNATYSGAGIPVVVSFTITEDGLLNTSENTDTGFACGGGVNVPDGDPLIVFGSSPVLSPLTCGDDSFTLNAYEFKFVGDPDDVDDIFDLTGGGGCFTSIDDLNSELTINLEKL